MTIHQFPASFASVDGAQKAKALLKFWPNGVAEQHRIIVEVPEGIALTKQILDVIKSVLSDFGNWTVQQGVGGCPRTKLKLRGWPIAAAWRALADKWND